MCVSRQSYTCSSAQFVPGIFFLVSNYLSIPSCKQLTKPFKSKRPALEFINSCILLRNFDSNDC